MKKPRLSALAQMNFCDVGDPLALPPQEGPAAR